MAFIVLAVLAAAIVGVQRAEARPGRFLAAAIGAGVRVQGTLPISADSFGPAVAAVTGHAQLFAKPLVTAGSSRDDETVTRDADRGDVVGSEPTRRGLPGRRWHEVGPRGGLERAGDSISGKPESAAEAVRRSRSLEALRESADGSHAGAGEDREVVDRATAAARRAAAVTRNNRVLGRLLRRAARQLR
jgi:hypothetical protein